MNIKHAVGGMKRLAVRNWFYLTRSFNPWWFVDERMAQDFDLLVMSPGGAGTTLLMTEIRNHRKINCIADTDGYKHLPFSSTKLAALLKNKKVVYIYDDPLRVTQSIGRRGWLRIQGSKLQSTLCVVLPEGFQKKIFTKAVRRQILGFHSLKHDNLLLVKFDNLWNDLPIISKFLALDGKEFEIDFPPKKRRMSK